VIQDASAVASKLVKRWEGFRSRPYICPAGVPTIGYGFTAYLDGTRVTLRDPPMSREAADILLHHLIIRDYMPAVMRLCPTINTPERLGAITDFCFNLGESKLRASTLRKRINSGDWEGAQEELMKWTRGGGRVLPGLVARRKAERDLLV
jgi:lysozyme